MTSKQGDVDLLKEPVAQRMLQSAVPARFAYNWSDGIPRGGHLEGGTWIDILWPHIRRIVSRA